MTPQAYDWAAEPDLSPPAPSARLEDALGEVVDRHLLYPGGDEWRRRFVHELATVATPFALAEVLRRLHELGGAMSVPFDREEAR